MMIVGIRPIDERTYRQRYPEKWSKAFHFYERSLSKFTTTSPRRRDVNTFPFGAG
jgi:hypothetical protein